MKIAILKAHLFSKKNKCTNLAASVFSHITPTSACGVVVTHQLPNVFFCFVFFFVVATTTPAVCVRDG